MSYVLTACVVDVDALQKAVGSADESLLQAAVQSNPDLFDVEDEHDGELSLTQALRRLIMGDLRDAADAHQYGYALQALCGHLGETIPPDAWGGVRWATVEACGLEALLTDTGPPVELPESDDLPTIGHLKRGELDAELKAARKRRDRAVDEELEDLLDEYIDWLEAARTAKLDLVFFYQ